MRKNFMVCAALLTIVSMSSIVGCEGTKSEQAEEMLHSILTDDQQVAIIDTEITTTIPETTTEEETTTQEITTEEETTTIPETTTEEETTTQEITTEEVTTTKKPVMMMAAKPQTTTAPETTTEEETTTQEETTTTVVEEETIDLDEAKEAFEKYVSENYTNVEGYDAIIINNIPSLYVKLDGEYPRLLTYCNDNVMDNVCDSSPLSWFIYRCNSKYIWNNLGQGTDTRGFVGYNIYEINEDGAIIELDASYDYKYSTEDNALVERYHKIVNNIAYEISESEFGSALESKGICGEYGIDYTRINPSSVTIDEAFTVLKEKMQ